MDLWYPSTTGSRQKKDEVKYTLLPFYFSLLVRFVLSRGTGANSRMQSGDISTSGHVTVVGTAAQIINRTEKDTRFPAIGYHHMGGGF